MTPASNTLGYEIPKKVFGECLIKKQVLKDIYHYNKVYIQSHILMKLSRKQRHNGIICKWEKA